MKAFLRFGIFLTLVLTLGSAFSSEFFTIKGVQFLKEKPKDGVGIWSFKKGKPNKFQPCLEVEAAARENTRSDKLIAKAYFFNEDNKLIATELSPTKSGARVKEKRHFKMPVLFRKNQPGRFFFRIPETIRKQSWKAVVVFGDSHEATAACYPFSESFFMLEFPEKKLVTSTRPDSKISRRPALEPLIQHVVETDHAKLPKITLFLRPPKGVTDASEINGVIAICILANSVAEVQRTLQKEEMSGDYFGMISFAKKHKLAILAWGSKRVWDPSKNWDDMSKKAYEKMDDTLDLFADAWERGVLELSKKYGIPTKNFLLWGDCGAAQWVHRLCLRKPEYFLAVSCPLSGSFDKPTPEANKVLWCVITGELYGGYERSLRFVKECRKLGYPLIYKAFIGAGHSGHPDMSKLTRTFLEFALTLKDEKEALTAKLTEKQWLSAPDIQNPWPELFRNPLYYGDMVNQGIFPASEVEMIPEAFRVPLPTKELADIWSRSDNRVFTKAKK